MIKPENREQKFNFSSLNLVNIKSSYLLSAKFILGILSLIILFLVFVPWQQTVVGVGRVTVFSPMDRPQGIFTQIDAKIAKWHVVEGQVVIKGEKLLELQEVDHKFLDIRQEERLREKRKTLLEKKLAIENSIQALASQVESLSILPENVKPAEALKIKQMQDRVIAAEKAVETAEFNLKRIQSLYAQGLRSKRDLELAELQKATKQAELDVAQRNAQLSELERNKAIAKTDAAIKAVQSDKAQAEERLAVVEADIIRLDIEISNLEYRKLQREIYAPITGHITRLNTVGREQTVVAGEQLAIIVPDVADQAVELYIADFNAPLMSLGRKVRLQFSGWPAVQFSGWPFLSVGTFGGVVSAIDAVDDGTGRFRIIVTPDEDNIKQNIDEHWPTYPKLRPGTQAQGWILLDTVTIGFEIWRQFNGFPPSFPEQADRKGIRH